MWAPPAASRRAAARLAPAASGAPRRLLAPRRGRCAGGRPLAAGARGCATGGAPPAQETDEQRLPRGIWAEKRQNRDSMQGREHMSSRLSRLKELGESEHIESLPAEQRRAIAEVSRLARQRRWQEALLLFGAVPDPVPKLQTAALDACAKALELERAQQLFDQMEEKTVPAYNVMINLHGRLKQVHVAEELLHRMREGQLRPTAVTHGCMINAYGMTHDSGAVMRVLEAAAVATDPCVLGLTKFGWAAICTVLGMFGVLTCIPFLLWCSRRRPPGQTLLDDVLCREPARPYGIGPSPDVPPFVATERLVFQQSRLASTPAPTV